ncbi:MAG TPA: 4-hydroxybenzoate octaprenyltransferase [Gammaproteobacteria bacterium]
MNAIPHARARARRRPLAQQVAHEAALLVHHYGRYARLMRLHQPIGIWLLLWPTLWALWIASAGAPSQHVFVILVLGTIIVRSAGCVINDFADRDIDPHVRRTAARPLASGEVGPSEALVLFAGLMLIAFGLVLTLNALTVLLALAAAVLAVCYPFAKRVFSAPQFVLGLAFSWGVPMAFAAQTGQVPRLGWLLFLTAVIWVVVYDTEYAMADREDDLKIGVNSTAVLLGDMDRAAIAGLHALLAVSLVLVGRTAELGPWYYAGVAAAACLALYQLGLIWSREPQRCFRAFLNNAWYGAAVFAGIALDFVFRAPSA